MWWVWFCEREKARGESRPREEKKPPPRANRRGELVRLQDVSVPEKDGGAGRISIRHPVYGMRWCKCPWGVRCGRDRLCLRRHSIPKAWRAGDQPGHGPWNRPRGQNPGGGQTPL